jgi:hypothetical protein
MGKGIMPKETEEKQVGGVWAGLPLTSVLKKPKFKQATELLEELQAINMQLESAQERSEEIKTILEAIQKESNLPGFRYGGLCFRSIPNTPGTRLDQTALKTELIERGVEPDVISEAVKAATKENKMNKPTKCEFRIIEI